MHPLRAALDALIPAAQAHEKWFVPSMPVTAPQPEFFRTLNPLTVGSFAAVAALALVGWLLDRGYERSSWYPAVEKRIRPLRDYAAGVLAVATGVTLLILAWRGQYLATNFPFPAGFEGAFLRSAETLIGLLLLIGLYTQAAAVGLIGLFLGSFLFFPAVDALDYAPFAVIGWFLLFFARGRYSLDWFLGKPISSTPGQRKKAYLALRVGMGVAVFWLALLKWRRPDLHLALMDRFPAWNPYVIASWFGLRMPRETYVFLLFVVESTIGLFEACGFLTRPLSLFLVPVFVGSIAFLGPNEMVGHLPILGILFVLFVYGDTYHKNRDPDRYGSQKTPG